MRPRRVAPTTGPQRVALYARRSTEEHQAASLDVQREEAARWVAARGWTMAPEHVFVDDAKSRAEFKKRPALIAMLNAAVRRDFDVVIARDETRIGGDTNRTSLYMSDLLETGVRLFYYFSDEEVLIDGAVDKFMINARNFVAELEREKISQRTHEHLQTKARKGRNVGGRCFGYDNVAVMDGAQRVAVDYVINEEQAEIVREIFRRYAAGAGLRTIAHELNARGTSPPAAGKRTTGSWSPGSIREMLRRQRYRGLLEWGNTEKAYRGGTKVRLTRPKEEVTVFEAPHLRIVDEELWDAVQNRGAKRERVTGTKKSGPPTRYLLSGIGRCAECNGPIKVGNVKVSYENVKAYLCAYYKDRGPTVCSNSTKRPVATVDAAVLGWLRDHVLQEGVILEALAELRRRLGDREKSQDTEVPALEARARSLRGEIDRLVSALAMTDQKPLSVLRALSEREAELTELDARLATLRVAPSVMGMEIRRMERDARGRLDDFSEMMGRNPEEARKALETLLAGPLRLAPVESPEGRRFSIEGELALEQILLVDGARQNGAPHGAPFTPSDSVPSGVRPEGAFGRNRVSLPFSARLVA